MNLISFAVIGIGAALGAWGRWMLALWLDPLFPTVTMGTLAANLIGGFLVGVAVAVLQVNKQLSPELSLFLITGFLGGLTTFSTFSAEVVALAQRTEWGWALGTVGLHVVGSLVMTGLGIFTVHKLAS